MTGYLEAVGLVLVGVILVLVVGRQSKDLGLLLSVGICTSLCISAACYLEELVGFLEELRTLGGLDRKFLSILLKCTGIGYISEIAGLVCADAGENAMGKALQILANAVVLFLSLPLIRQVLTLLEEVLKLV